MDAPGGTRGRGAPGSPGSPPPWCPLGPLGPSLELVLRSSNWFHWRSVRRWREAPPLGRSLGGVEWHWLLLFLPGSSGAPKLTAEHPPTQANCRAYCFCQKLMLRKLIAEHPPTQTNCTHPPTVVPWVFPNTQSMRNRVWVEQVITDKRAGHNAPLGDKSGSPHLLKFLMGWRPLTWWRHQQDYNLISLDTLYHPVVGKAQKVGGRITC